MDRFNNRQSGSMPFFTEDGAFCPAAVYSTLAGTFC